MKYSINVEETHLKVIYRYHQVKEITVKVRIVYHTVLEIGSQVQGDIYIK